MGDGIPTRNSYGIICVRRIGQRPRYQILMVKKKFTYAFILFAKGAYTKGDYRRLSDILHKMTVEEKCLILTRDYSFIAKQLHMPVNNKFLQLARQYDETMRSQKFIKMIKSCKTHGHLRWEVPKGKKNDSFETDIQAALREFTEETGMQKDSFGLLPGITRVDSYVDERVRYVTKYFVGYSRVHTDPTVAHLIDNEISDVRWMDMAELAITDALGNAHMRHVVKPAVSAIKKALRSGLVE